MEKATFGAGCFWGVEAAFRCLQGVVSTAVGYSGGMLENPTYQDVCSNRTGHAEVVEVVYDPSVVSYDALLEVFWGNHDPTTLNRQGPDVGTQYRSVIFYHNEAQKAAAEMSMQNLRNSDKYKKAIVTEIKPAAKFYRAEEYHQRYLEKRGHAGCNIP
jgi:peptide-methionine (S)-S-oxide reductase